MKSLVCLLVLFCGALCYAQTRSTTLPLSDTSSPKQQFIAFEGSITFSEQVTDGKVLQTQTATASGTVLSEKPIVALVAHFEWFGFGGDRSVSSARHDHFFGAQDLTKGLSIDFLVPEGNVLTMPQGEVPTNDNNGAVPASKYTVELAFVQFADGTIWGDKNIGDELTAQRADITAYLQHLVSAYESGDKESFVAAMELAPVSTKHQQRTSAFAVRKHVQMIQSQSGREAAIAFVRDELTNAAARRASGNFQ